MLNNIGKAGNVILRIIMGVIAFICIFIGVFILCENLRTESSAFTPYELSKYKPKIGGKESISFDELNKLNKDAVGWLVMYGTKINYPVLRGKDDKEYLNKNAFGEPDISGSLYLSSLNNRDMNDNYLLVYGHHMNSGNMFGDLDKYKDKKFFDKKEHNRTGIFITKDKVYDVNAFALINTTGYDDNIYYVDSINQRGNGSLLPYLKANATHYTKPSDPTKIIALSTCSDYITSARLVLLCELDNYTGKSKYEITDNESPLSIMGHHMSTDYFSFLNLCFLFICLYAAFPLHIILKNFIQYIKRKMYLFKHPEEAEKEKEIQKLKRKMFLHDKKEIVKLMLKILIIVIAIITIIVFYLFENVKRPMIMADEWTPLFIMFAVTIWILQSIASQHKRGKTDNSYNDQKVYTDSEGNQSQE